MAVGRVLVLLLAAVVVHAATVEQREALHPVVSEAHRAQSAVQDAREAVMAIRHEIELLRNEEGTSAAAVTAAQLARDSTSSQDPPGLIDHVHAETQQAVAAAADMHTQWKARVGDVQTLAQKTSDEDKNRAARHINTMEQEIGKARTEAQGRIAALDHEADAIEERNVKLHTNKQLTELQIKRAQEQNVKQVLVRVRASEQESKRNEMAEEAKRDADFKAGEAKRAAKQAELKAALDKADKDFADRLAAIKQQYVHKEEELKSYLRGLELDNARAAFAEEQKAKAAGAEKNQKYIVKEDSYKAAVRTKLMDHLRKHHQHWLAKVQQRRAEAAKKQAQDEALERSEQAQKNALTGNELEKNVKAALDESRRKRMAATMSASQDQMHAQLEKDRKQSHIEKWRKQRRTSTLEQDGKRKRIQARKDKVVDIVTKKLQEVIVKVNIAKKNNLIHEVSAKARQKEMAEKRAARRRERARRRAERRHKSEQLRKKHKEMWQKERAKESALKASLAGQALEEEQKRDAAEQKVKEEEHEKEKRRHSFKNLHQKLGKLEHHRKAKEKRRLAACNAARKTFHASVEALPSCSAQQGDAHTDCVSTGLVKRVRFYKEVRSACKKVEKTECVDQRMSYWRRITKGALKCKPLKGADKEACYAALKSKRWKWMVPVLANCNTMCLQARATQRDKFRQARWICDAKTVRKERRKCFAVLRRKRSEWHTAMTSACQTGLIEAMAKRASTVATPEMRKQMEDGARREEEQKKLEQEAAVKRGEGREEALNKFHEKLAMEARDKQEARQKLANENVEEEAEKQREHQDEIARNERRFKAELEERLVKRRAQEREEKADALEKEQKALLTGAQLEEAQKQARRERAQKHQEQESQQKESAAKHHVRERKDKARHRAEEEVKGRERSLKYGLSHESRAKWSRFWGQRKCNRSKRRYYRRVRVAMDKCAGEEEDDRPACFFNVQRNRIAWFAAVQSSCQRQASEKCRAAKKNYFEQMGQSNAACGTKKDDEQIACFQELQSLTGQWYGAVVRACTKGCSRAHRAFRARVARATLHCNALIDAEKTACLHQLEGDTKIWKAEAHTACRKHRSEAAHKHAARAHRRNKLLTAEQRRKRERKEAAKKAAVAEAEKKREEAAEEQTFKREEQQRQEREAKAEVVVKTKEREAQIEAAERAKKAERVQKEQAAQLAKAAARAKAIAESAKKLEEERDVKAREQLAAEKSAKETQAKATAKKEQESKREIATKEAVNKANLRGKELERAQKESDKKSEESRKAEQKEKDTKHEERGKAKEKEIKAETAAREKAQESMRKAKETQRKKEAHGKHVAREKARKVAEQERKAERQRKEGDRKAAAKAEHTIKKEKRAKYHENRKKYLAAEVAKKAAIAAKRREVNAKAKVEEERQKALLHGIRLEKAQKEAKAKHEARVKEAGVKHERGVKKVKAEKHKKRVELHRKEEASRKQRAEQTKKRLEVQGKHIREERRKAMAVCLAAKAKYEQRVAAAGQRCQPMEFDAQRLQCFAQLKKDKKTWYSAVSGACPKSLDNGCLNAKAAYRRKVGAAANVCVGKATIALRQQCLGAVKVDKALWYEKEVVPKCFSKPRRCALARRRFYARSRKERRLCLQKPWAEDRRKCLKALCIAKNGWRKTVVNFCRNARHSARFYCLVAKRQHFHKVRRAAGNCKKSHPKGDKRLACYKNVQSKRKTWYNRDVKKWCKHRVTKQCKVARKKYYKFVLDQMTKCSKQKNATLKGCKQQVGPAQREMYKDVRKVCIWGVTNKHVPASLRHAFWAKWGRPRHPWRRSTVWRHRWKKGQK